jgi:hypothetical protein
METRAITPEIGLMPMLSFIDGLANMDITQEHIARMIDDIHGADGRMTSDVATMRRAV